MIEQAEMEVGQVFGSYEGDAFDEERSTRCIIFAKKK
jgi:hypothetical protein